MPLRCLLFSSDEETAHSIGFVLADLGMEAELTHLAVEAVKRVTNENFQIVIVDWDNREEAGFLIKTARERKASERPLSLAIVSNDQSVPQALQAGANSVLRKPILANQAKDTLTTARDLLRSRIDAAAPMARAAAASAGAPASEPQTFTVDARSEEPAFRAGEFLQSSAPAPSAQFVTESEAQHELENPPLTPEQMEPLEDLTATAEELQGAPLPEPVPYMPQPAAAPSDGPRGLEWYLKNRGAAAAPQAAPAEESPEMAGYDEAAAYNAEAAPAEEVEPAEEVHSLEDALKRAKHASQQASAQQAEAQPEHQTEHEQKTEAALFAHIAGEIPKEKGESAFAKLRPWIGKIALVGALAAVAAFAYFEVPHDAWGKNISLIAESSRRKLHAWLNPNPTPSTAPVQTTHENFARAGDEYKLPVPETIPDATTDPSQIRVVPVIDPTAKQPSGAANPDQAAGQAAADPTQPGAGPAQPNAVPATDGQPAQSTPTVVPGTSGPTASGTISVTPNLPPESHTDIPASTPVQTPSQPSAQAPEQIQVTPIQPQQRPAPRPTTSVPSSTASIPSSLKSQMASMTPDASGNKPVEAALLSIEPVKLPETTVRGLLAQQVNPVYPANAGGRQGTVILQVLIGRDGGVQDAKFLQGSLAFARAAIDAVSQWKFKPYLMNGRPVSVQTQMTLSFAPGA